MWNDAYELAERLCGTELEKWQVLEPSLAEFLGTHLPHLAPGGAGAHETDDEKELPNKVRDAVLDRDMWQCKFPGCTMRKMLDVHHIEFRSHLGSEDLGNQISVCRIHHGLVHRGICKITGTVDVDLKFERPQLVTEQKPAEAKLVIQYQNEPPEEASDEEASDEEVALPDDNDDTTTTTTKARATRSSPTCSMVHVLRSRRRLSRIMAHSTRIGPNGPYGPNGLSKGECGS